MDKIMVGVNDTLIPVTGFENEILREGDSVKFEIEVFLKEPAIYGFDGVVFASKAIGIRRLSDMQDTVEKD